MIFLLLRKSLAGQMAAGMSLLATIAFAAWPDIGLPVTVMFLSMVPTIVSQRATPFEAALPLRARSIFLVRTMYALVLVWIPLITWIIAAQMHGQAGGLPLFTTTLNTRLEVLGIATLATILPNLVRVGELGLPPSQTTLLPWAALLIASVSAILYLSPQAAMVALALASAAAFHVAWRAMPESFQLAPRKPPGTGMFVVARPRTAVSQKAEPRWWRPVLRSGFTWMSLLGAFMMVTSSIGGMWVLYLSLYSVMILLPVRHQTRWMYALPFSPRKFLWINMACFLVPFLGGLLVGKVVLSRMVDFESPNSQSPRLQHQFRYRTNVSLAFWQPLPNGQEPIIQAPWGETSPANTLPVFGVTLYNPYSADTSRTKRFLDWQFERATTVIYGRAISFAQYDSGKVVLPSRVTRNARTFILGGALVVTLALFVVLLCEFPRWHVFARRPSIRILAMALAAVPLLAIFIVEMYYTSRHGTSIIAPLMEPALLRLSKALPAGIVPVIIVATLPVIAMYSLLEWQFRRSEFPDRVPQKRPW